MKTILIDAINTLIIKDVGVFQEIYNLLEKYPNRKIVVTNAEEEKIKIYNLNPENYEIFTLNKNPEKSNPEFFKKLLQKFNLNSKDVIYIEHNLEVVKSAKTLGINCFHYNKEKNNLLEIKNFIDNNL